MQLTQIVNGQITELVLCESCARNKGLFDPQSLSFAEQFFPEEFKKKVEDIVKELAGGRLLTDKNNSSPHSTDALVSCPVCDFTLETYRRTGRLGCPDCYRVFAREIAEENATLTDVESNTGTVPTESPALTRKKLEQQLQQAVDKEDYETAAKLRDRIRELS